MSADILKFTGLTVEDIPSHQVLDGAKESFTEYGNIVVIGWDKNDDFYMASSNANVEKLLYLLKTAEIAVMSDSENL
jgi:cell wall assembly regulator SMI1